MYIALLQLFNQLINLYNIWHGHSATVVGTGQSVQWLTTDWTVWRSNPSWGESFHQGQTGPKAHPASCTISTRSFPGVKWLECGADHPPPSHARLLTVWSCNSNSPLCLHRHVMCWPLSSHQVSSVCLIAIIFGCVQVVIKKWHTNSWSVGITSTK